MIGSFSLASGAWTQFADSVLYNSCCGQTPPSFLPSMPTDRITVWPTTITNIILPCTDLMRTFSKGSHSDLAQWCIDQKAVWVRLNMILLYVSVWRQLERQIDDNVIAWSCGVINKIYAHNVYNMIWYLIWFTVLLKHRLFIHKT